MRHKALLLTFALWSTIFFSAQSLNKRTENAAPNVIQSEFLGNKYLKVIATEDPENDYWANTTIQVFEKSTDKLLQSIDSIYVMKSDNDIEVSDYNFDGQYEFSIFSQQALGANTNRIYYLYDSAIDRFVESGFEGTSLEFDPVEKRIYERNQSCGGSSIMEAIYKVKNNEMVLIEKHCYELDLASAESEFGLEYNEVDCE